jgi:hypothetical protein
MIRYSLKHGWAHIEEDPEGTPFLVNSHGGRMPLQSVRWDPGIGGSEMRSEGHVGHRFGTVCDTVDALVASVGKGDPDENERLITDVVDMVERMNRRQKEVNEALVRAQRELADVSPEIEPALGIQEMLLGLTDGKNSVDAAKIGQAIKEIAGSLEQRLEENRSKVLTLGKLYLEIRGERDWDSLLMSSDGGVEPDGPGHRETKSNQTVGG